VTNQISAAPSKSITSHIHTKPHFITVSKLITIPALPRTSPKINSYTMIDFGVIGTSTISHNFAAHAHASGQWNLRAVYSRSKVTAQAFASKHGQGQSPKIYTTIEGLAGDESIQAVYIASPNSLHYSHAKTCLEGGKHVILEKPSTSTSAELATLFAAAHSHGVLLLEAHRHLQEANFKALRSGLPLLGAIYGASLTYASYSSRYDAVLAGAEPNIFSLEFSGGSLVDIGVYGVAAAIALFGPPKSATYDPVIVATGVDGGGPVVLRYEGFAVTVLQSKCYTSTAPSEVYGEKGTLRVNGVTDIDSVEFVDAKTKAVTKLGGEKCKYNLMEECVEFARIINSRDHEEAAKLETLSKEVLKVTEKLRKDNGIIFAVER